MREEPDAESPPENGIGTARNAIEEAGWKLAGESLLADPQRSQ
jgi:hypothetical protein